MIIIKNKAGNVNAIDNYRPVALSSILSKVLENIILCRIECYLTTNANQFGFKRKHGTDLCIYTFKEMVDISVVLIIGSVSVILVISADFQDREW